MDLGTKFPMFFMPELGPEEGSFKLLTTITHNEPLVSVNRGKRPMGDDGRELWLRQYGRNSNLNPNRYGVLEGINLEDDGCGSWEDLAGSGSKAFKEQSGGEGELYPLLLFYAPLCSQGAGASALTSEMHPP